MSIEDKKSALSEDAQNTIEEHVKSIRSILNDHDLDIDEMINLVVEKSSKSLKKPVEVRFADSNSTLGPMNMVAFD